MDILSNNKTRDYGATGKLNQVVWPTWKRRNCTGKRPVWRADSGRAEGTQTLWQFSGDRRVNACNGLAHFGVADRSHALASFFHSSEELIMNFGERHWNLWLATVCTSLNWLSLQTKQCKFISQKSYLIKVQSNKNWRSSIWSRLVTWM